VKEKYDAIMKHPVMVEYESARAELDGILKQVDNIINYYITGEESSGSCDPSKCAGCAGCNH
jgi:small nuclear ribonucleoprotein (snRNP)-like protein